MAWDRAEVYCVYCGTLREHVGMMGELLTVTDPICCEVDQATLNGAGLSEAEIALDEFWSKILFPVS